MLSRLRVAVDRTTGFAAVLGALCATALMIAISIDVASRQVFNRSVPGMVELSETMLIALVFLGVAQAERTKAHIRLTVIVDRLPARGSAAVRTVAFIVAMLVVAWMAWETGARAIDSIERREYRLGLLQWPLWPARALLPLGLTLLALQLFFRITDAIQDLISGRGSPQADIYDAEVDGAEGV